jgi:hypothetical protein
VFGAGNSLVLLISEIAKKKGIPHKGVPFLRWLAGTGGVKAYDFMGDLTQDLVSNPT